MKLITDGRRITFIVMASSNENAIHVTGTLWGESTGHWRFPSQRLVKWMMFTLMRAWTNGLANGRDAGDSRCHDAHYDVTVMRRTFSNAFSLMMNLFTPQLAISRDFRTKPLPEPMLTNSNGAICWVSALGHKELSSSLAEHLKSRMVNRM